MVVGGFYEVSCSRRGLVVGGLKRVATGKKVGCRDGCLRRALVLVALVRPR